MNYIELDLQKLLYEAKQEVETIYNKCKNNKKFKYDSKIRKDWYYKHLRDRIQYKVYIKHKVTAFGVIEKYINSVIPKIIDDNIDQFVDVKNIELGNRS